MPKGTKEPKGMGHRDSDRLADDADLGRRASDRDPAPPFPELSVGEKNE